MSAYKYYLRINGKIIIHLEDYKNYGPMTDFLNLNLFTSDFNNITEIGEELKRLGVLKNNVEIETMDIVYQSRDKYFTSAETPLLKGEYPYFGDETIKDFFKKNSHNYTEMGRIIARSKGKLDKMIRWLNYEDTRKPKFIEMVRLRLSNINRLEVLIVNLISHHSEYLEEYTSRLKEFIESEIYYKKGDKFVVNYHGLLDMTRTVLLALKYYPHFEKPIINLKPKTKPIVFKQEEETIDPDEYMFLENDDFVNQYNHEYKDVLEDQIENLSEKKKRL